MSSKHIQVILFIVFGITLISIKSTAQNAINEEHIEVSLRMIGHEILLQSGDSSSRILPIEKKENKYRIKFDSDFQFHPDELNTTIDEIVKKTNIAEHYIVEVEDCSEQQVYYSFEIDNTEELDIIPCKRREQPLSCYTILFIILDPSALVENSEPKYIEHNKQFDILLYFLVLTPLFVVFGLFFNRKKKKNSSEKNPNLISIGKFLYDERNMQLIIEEQHIELTSKESDLLQLLYKNANNTVEREVILNSVWGDEGDYVGRTLDVYISKLRKKLESDDRIKIINTRGIGYKLILNVD